MSRGTDDDTTDIGVAGGPMTDMTTINLPLMAVEHRSLGNRAYCTIYIDAKKKPRRGTPRQ